MSQPVRISVVMPSFNQASYLKEAIESVLAQGASLHEFIILDGGSTDDSAEVIRSYEQHLTYWRSAPDGGQTHAIKEGFDRATGDVLCWLNSDDLFLPGALDRVAEAFQQYPDAGVVSGYLYYIDEHSRVRECPQVLTGNPLLAKLGVVNVNQQATFFRRDLYHEVGGVDASLHCAMDMDLWCRLHLSGRLWVPIPSYLAAFRKHSEQKGSGGAWWDRYQDEKAKVRARYPSIYGSPLKQKFGLACYRLAQLASGRHLRSIKLSRERCGHALREALPS